MARNEDSANLIDKLLGVVRTDRSKLPEVLNKNSSARGELEPAMRAAIAMDSVEQPVMSSRARHEYRQRVLALGASASAAGAK